jgi:hypothetical protein
MKEKGKLLITNKYMPRHVLQFWKEEKRKKIAH